MNVGIVTLYNPLESYVDGTYTTGGIENHALYLAKGFAELGHDAWIITMGDVREPTVVEEAGVKAYLLPDGGTDGLVERSVRFVGHIPGLCEFFRQTADIDLLFGEAGLAVPLVFWRPESVRATATIVHTLDREEVRTVRDDVRRGAYASALFESLRALLVQKPYRSLMFARAETLIFVSEAVRREYLDYYPYLPERQSHVIENGWPDVDGAATTGPRETDFIYAGRIGKRKRVDLVVEAVDYLRTEGPCPEVAIAGDGNLAPEVTAYSRELGCEDEITFLGFVEEHEDLLSRIGSAKYLVLPSTYESDPLVLKEALSLGVPCIVSDIPALTDTVVDGYNGFVFESGDSASMASVMRKAARVDETAYERLRENATDSVASHSWRDVATAYLAAVTDAK